MENADSTMSSGGAGCSASPAAKPQGIVGRLGSWWRRQDPDQRYLAAATDLADLERRMRILERAGGAPMAVTFNH